MLWRCSCAEATAVAGILHCGTAERVTIRRLLVEAASCARPPRLAEEELRAELAAAPWTELAAAP